MLVGRTADGPGAASLLRCGAGFLFALALWVRPNLAPGAARAARRGRACGAVADAMPRLAGLCIGFLPVFGMALHNWYFGGVFVLFSSNATIAEAVPMPPSAYVAAAGELLRLDFAGEHSGAASCRWRAGSPVRPKSFFTVPLNAAAVAGAGPRRASARAFDPWLRLIAGATLALQRWPGSICPPTATTT